MCGRYAMPLEQQKLREELQNLDLPINDTNTPSYNRSYTPSYNFSPTREAPVYTNHQALAYPSWGLRTAHINSNHSSTSHYSTFNARKEKVQSHASPLWNSVLQTRCVIPITGYYEWKTQGSKKIPYYVTREDGLLMFMLGFYNTYRITDKDTGEEKVNGSFTVLTRPAGNLSWLHDRTPMIVKPHSEEWERWLDPDTKFTDSLLDFENYEDGMKCIRVSSDVGNVRNDGSYLVREIKSEKEIDSWFDKHAVKREEEPKLKNEQSSENDAHSKPKAADSKVKKERTRKREKTHQTRSIKDLLQAKQKNR